MKLKLIAPLLLIVSTLFFVANAYAYAKKLDTNISGLVLKDLSCSYGRIALWYFPQC